MAKIDFVMSILPDFLGPGRAYIQGINKAKDN